VVKVCEHNCTVIVQFGCLLCCSGIHAAFVGGVLRVFDEINFYILSHLSVYRVFCGYM
jgi:hypothetical protein